MMEAARTSETSVYFNEDYQLHTAASMILGVESIGASVTFAVI
jgi:hypothetical protein